jgi:L,D-transpeptidase YnhG
MKFQTFITLVLVAFSIATHTFSHAETSANITDTTSFKFLALNPKTVEGIRNIPSTSRQHSANERRLVQVMNSIAAGDLNKATRLAQALSRHAPNYALGHLIYADLLRLQTPQDPAELMTETFKENWQFIEQSLTSELPSLQASQLEMSLRLKALGSMPAQGMVPQHLFSLGRHYRQLLVADTKLGRLHLFDIRHNSGQTRLHLKHSFFMTIGDQGAGKQIEGDKKSPLGIYQLMDRIPQEILTDLYGSGALNINYPNPVDRELGRTGFGIWFHGSPSNTYVRYPFSSDGCLVLSNDDMIAMLSAATPQQTLIIIDDGVEWKPSTELVKNNQTLAHPLLNQLSTLIEAFSGNTPEFNSEIFYDGGSKWEYRLLRLVQSNKNTTKDIQVQNFTVVEWRRDSPYMMVEFDFQLNSESYIYRVRQYWMEVAGGWKIVREAFL